MRDVAAFVLLFVILPAAVLVCGFLALSAGLHSAGLEHSRMAWALGSFALVALTWALARASVRRMNRR